MLWGLLTFLSISNKGMEDFRPSSFRHFFLDGPAISVTQFLKIVTDPHLHEADTPTLPLEKLSR